MSPCLHVSVSPFFIISIENQLLKFHHVKITRTAPNEFNICELSSDELVAILSCIDCLVHPEHEAMPADFLQNLRNQFNNCTYHKGVSSLRFLPKCEPPIAR